MTWVIIALLVAVLAMEITRTVMLHRANRQLLAEVGAQLEQRCASCGGPAGPDPMIVQDHLHALLDRPPIQVRYFICQTCGAPIAEMPEEPDDYPRPLHPA